VHGICGALLSVAVGAIAGVTGSRLVQYGILGAAIGAAIGLAGITASPKRRSGRARIAMAGGTGVGDSLPRSRPTFAAWSNVFVLASVFIFAVDAAMLAAAFAHAREAPVLFIVIAGALTLGFGVPSTLGLAFSPSLQPIRDLAEGTERRSIACRRVWLSGNDFRQRSEPTSTRRWRRGCCSRVMTCLPVSAEK
jgi:hypothetical protein